MPTISTFYGLVIQMFYRDHSPPHFHVRYAEYKAVIDLKKLLLIEGELPRRALELVLDWAELHQIELMEDWMLCQNLKAPKPIAPLE
ncbi:DUF4160 domain-containing protein [Herbaspirillum sp. C7C2]|uniref:DUF4160 domain-containing protein n=1 Tax=Herbaspirillum sp. C7C2 TaxID=2736666 RepID=UPI001F51B36D|nr:DUF4160 domain-containing protein [Herbaspirillum sp. C7C2]